MRRYSQSPSPFDACLFQFEGVPTGVLGFEVLHLSTNPVAAAGGSVLGGKVLGGSTGALFGGKVFGGSSPEDEDDEPPRVKRGSSHLLSFCYASFGFCV